MCGRYTLRKGLSEIAEKIGDYLIDGPTENASSEDARYNIAPTQYNLILRKSFTDATKLQVAYLRWGLIPSWVKTAQQQSPLINARSETVAEKASFKAAFKRRRCLIPADGFYEWKKQKGTNQPFFFEMTDASVFLMAGIWEAWVGEHGQKIESYTILTTQANTLLSKYHDRMPVILTGDRIRGWMEADVTTFVPQERDELFAPLESKFMVGRPANPVVNNNRSEGPECLEAPPNDPVSQLDLGI